MEQIRHFLNSDGLLKLFPAKRKMKIHVLFYLASKFESGRQYTEQEVNHLLLRWHTFGDPATLRREMVDYHLLIRSADGRSYHLNPTPPTPEELIP